MAVEWGVNEVDFLFTFLVPKMWQFIDFLEPALLS